MLGLQRDHWRMTSVILALIGVLVIFGCNGDSAEPTTDYEGTELAGAAPDFRLIDQKGDAIALSDFRGKVVVLAFMDSRCDETCPLTALELRTAYQSLGEAAAQAVVLGVNVNANFNSREDVDAFTAEFKLNEIPPWHFLTGAAEELSSVWKAYFIEVRVQPEEEDFDHTPGLYVIDQDGNMRWYISVPLQEEEWSGPPLSDLLTKRVRELLKVQP